MLKLSKGLDHCLKTYTECWTSDTAFAVCLRDAEVEIDQFHSYPFYNSPLDEKFTYPHDPCTLPISFSELKHSQIHDLVNFDASHNPLEEYPTTTAADIMSLFLKDEKTIFPGIDFPGMDYSKIPTLSSDSCRDLCEQDSECISYSFAGMMCFKKFGIPKINSKPQITSGIIKKNYACRFRDDLL